MMDNKHDIGWAIEQLKTGNTIRLSDWNPGRYVSLNWDRILTNENGQSVNLAGLLFEYDWELHHEAKEPPETFGFIEAMRRMDLGAKVRRIGKEWFMDGDILAHRVSFECVAATDWVEL